MYLVFDIGGTNMRVAVSSDRENIQKSKIVTTPKDFEQGIQTLKQLADELLGKEKVQAVAGGIAGTLDKDKGVLVSSPHLKDWVLKPLKVTLEKKFAAPVYLENDTALAGLGEALKGAASGKNIVAYLSIGTGVGGVRIVDQKIDRNSLGFEPGHQIIILDGSKCNCGGLGHLEAYIAGSYLEKVYGRKGEELKNEEIWEEASKYLSIGLCNTIVHWSPDIVILGGAVMKSIDLEKVKINLRRNLTIFPESPEIIPAKLGDQAGLYGALELFK